MYSMGFTKSKRSSIPENKIEIQYYSNEDFLLRLDEINIKISKLISQRKHNLLFNIFEHYISCEIYLQDYINDIQLKLIRNNKIKQFNELIELRNYYNSFRILLISQIAECLVSIYNVMMKNLYCDLLRSTKMFTYFKKVLNFYIQKIKKKLYFTLQDTKIPNMGKKVTYTTTLKIFLELKDLLNTIPKNKKTFFTLMAID